MNANPKIDDSHVKQKTISYELIYSDGKRFEHSVTLSSDNLLHEAPSGKPPEWARLEYHQCDICPLSTKSHDYCPLAVRIAPLCDIPDTNTQDKVTVNVYKESVTFSNKVSIQEAYRSLVGLMMATSGCPHTAFFKPMAWFHLPFSDREETLFRACASFLLYQLFNPAPPGERSYFSDLENVYMDIQHVNQGIGERMRAAQANTSTLGAIIALDLFATTILPKIQDSLGDMSFLFETP